MTYQREGLIANRDALEPIFERHWTDVTPDFAGIELGFDWEAYGALEEAGTIHFMVAREGEQIVGYHMCFVQRHLHSMDTQVAHTTFFYMMPEFRKGWAGVNLFRATEKSLKGYGVRHIYLGSKADKNIAPILMRLGYHQVETIYAKVLA